MPTDSRSEVVRSLLDSAESLIKSLFVLNGAAAAGLLTFVGNTIDKKDTFHSYHSFSTALLLFALGLVCVLFAAAAKVMSLNFSSQTSDTLQSQEEARIFLIVTSRTFIFAAVAALFCLFSIAAFIAGICLGRYAIFG